VGTFDGLRTQPDELFAAMIEHLHVGLNKRFESMVNAVVVQRALCVGATQWMLERG
jgi:hypothetical protein